MSAELVAQALDGDTEAFGKLYDQYAALVRAVCRGVCGDVHTAEELAQEAFAKAYANLHQLRDGDRFCAWVTRIGKLTAYEWRRKHKGSKAVAVGLPTDIKAKPDDSDRSRAEVCLDRAIQRLPDRERLAVHLFYIDEASAESSRAALGLSSSGFYKLLERGRSRLANWVRQCLEQW